MWLLLTEFSYNKMLGLFAATAKGGHSNEVTVFRRGSTVPSLQQSL